jgi:hypothetical protein
MTVTFNPQAFLQRYPEFATIDQAAVVNVSVTQGSLVMTINSVTSGIVAPGEAVGVSALVVPNTIPFGITISSFGTFNGTSGTVNLSSPALATMNNFSMTFYMWNLLTTYFNEAQFMCRNDGGGPVQDIPTLTYLLNLVTAHKACLGSGVNGQTPTQIVGRVTSAGLGSVHVSTEMKMQDEAAYWTQTKYGTEYWEATTAYRLGGHFVAPFYDIFGDVGW